MCKENWNSPYWDNYLGRLANSRRKANNKGKQSFLYSKEWEAIETIMLTVANIALAISIIIYFCS